MDEQDLFYNPTDLQRHQILQESLDRVGRADDYENVLELLSPPPDIFLYAKPGALKKTSKGIIGGGLAGLAAAYELRKLGADITLFDAEKQRLGGRIYTYFFDHSKKYYGEFGAMRIPVSHETTWHYINNFRLNTESLSAPEANNFIYAHKTRIRREPGGQNISEYLYPYYDLTEVEKNLSWPQLSDYAANTMLYSLTPEKRTEILKILPEYSDEYAAITQMSNRRVFESLGLSQGAINLISAVEPFTAALLNVSHDETMNSIYSLDFLNTYRISGGMENLVNAFYDSLMSDVPREFEHPSFFIGNTELRLGFIVRGISMSQNCQKVDLRFSSHNGKEYMESFDYVVCAIPFTTLREIEITPLFSNQKMQAIRELNYIDAQKTLFFCRKRFWEENKEYGYMNGGISFTDLPVQTIVYPPDHIRCSNQESCTYEIPGVLTASYNLCQDSGRVSNQNITHRFNLIKRNVEQVHGTPPGYLDSLVQSHKTVHWNTQVWSRGAFAVYAPGQKVSLAYYMQQPEFNNRVFFAGEHVSTKQGWIQGALQTGKAAANMIAQQKR